MKEQGLHCVMRHTFVPAEDLKLENEGTTTLQFYLADRKDAADIPGTGITLSPGQHKTIHAADLGNIADTYVIVYNPDMNLKGEFVVEFV